MKGRSAAGRTAPARRHCSVWRAASCRRAAKGRISDPAIALGHAAIRDAGQMVVELCVVMPVVLMVAVAIIDGLVFTAAASKFDHLSSQAVLAEATAPSGTEFDSDATGADVQSLLAEELGESRASVDVAVTSSGRVYEFRCTMTMVPWPLGAGGSVMGMPVPALLKHESAFCVRPYVIGEL